MAKIPSLKPSRWSVREAQGQGQGFSLQSGVNDWGIRSYRMTYFVT